MIYLTKEKFTALGEIFAAEIAGNLPFQSKSIIYCKLSSQGLVETSSKVLGVRFPITVSGYILTQAGRYAYCSNCERFMTAEELAEAESDHA